MPRLMIPSALVLASVAFAAPLEAQTYCRGTPASSGYPVSATWIESGGGSPEYLKQILDVAVYRWRAPNLNRYGDRNLTRVHRWLRPPEPRWADEALGGDARQGKVPRWRPEARHTATMPITLYRNGDVHVGDILSESGDGLFDNSLETVAEKPMPDAPEFPVFRASAVGDSVVVLLHFGEAVADAPLIRFAAEQTPSWPTRGTLNFYSTLTDIASNGNNNSRRKSISGGGSWAVIKYDVMASGAVDPSTTEILGATTHAYGKAVESAVKGGSFVPATANCRPISVSVIRTFGLRGR